MTRMSVSCSKRWVAKLCRRVCGATRFLIPAASAAAWTARMAYDRKPSGKIRPLERHGEEETQGRDRAVDARRLHAALRLVELEAAQILRCRRIGRAADEGRERPDVANVVVARLLAEAAHAHVLDHALTQRAAGTV